MGSFMLARWKRKDILLTCRAKKKGVRGREKKKKHIEGRNLEGHC